MSKNVFLSKEVKPTEELIKENLLDTYSQLKEIRNLFFITICNGYFNLTFVFGDKAVGSIGDSAISPSLKTALMEARKFAEGRGLSIKVEDDKYLSDIKMLLQIKTAANLDN